MEEGKMAPILSRAGELADKAKAWADAPIPAAFDKAPVKDLLGKLSTESKALADMIAAKAPEADVKKSLTALHDRFHEITGACKVDEHKGHKDHKEKKDKGHKH
jgi:hypothetical protein